MQKQINREFYKYISLNVLGMLGLSCYILADTFFISKRLGADGLTALNLAISVYSIINGLGLMLGIGGATRFAICRAQGEKEKGNQVFAASAVAGTTVGIVLLLIGLVGSDAVAGMLGAEGNIQKMTGSYLKTILGFTPFFIMNNILIAFVRNDGCPRLSMAAMLTGSFSNIVLDYVFLFPCNMGIFGAALATGFAPVISIGLLSLHFIRGKNQFTWSSPMGALCCRVRDICSLGISAFINELSSAVVLIVFNLLILHLAGNTGVAAYGIVANLALVAVSVFTGISQGSQPLISRFYGEGRKKESAAVFARAAILAGAVGIFFSVAAFAFTANLVGIFNGEGNRELAEIAFWGLRLYFLGFCPAGVNIVAAAYMGAVEKGRESFAIAFVRGVAAILFFAFLLSFIWKMDGIWLAFPAAEISTLLLTAWFLKRYKNPVLPPVEK